jgi:hypothetical protein
MYYENPVENDDNESELETDSEVDVDNASLASDVTPARLTRQQVAKADKLADPGYNVVRKMTGKKPNGKSKIMKIEMYSTHSNPGYHIRNPVHGHRYTDTVGSLAEHGFFKVRNVSIGDGTNPITLYYDSPEAYEAHQRTTVPPDIKRSWQEKKKRHGF